MTGTGGATGLIALGANLSTGGVPPIGTLPAAMDAVAARVGGAVARSRLYATPAFPPGSGPDFVNAAMRLDWAGRAEHLLDILHEVEAGFGRVRGARWQARTMDLDLIALGCLVLPDAPTQAAWRALAPDAAARMQPDRLILPHPRLAERAFVLVPLAEVAPDWVDPATGLSLSRMLDALPEAERAAVRALDEAPGGVPGRRPQTP